METATIIHNSPLEFIIIGPQNGQDTVLIKSDNAGLDLIGFVASGDIETGAPSLTDTLDILLGKTRTINFISSKKDLDIKLNTDSRKSYYYFIWRGRTTFANKKKIEKEFKLIIPFLRTCIANMETADIEFAVSSIIYQCVIANNKQKFLVRLFQSATIIYFIIGLATLLAVFIQNISKTHIPYLK